MPIPLWFGDSKKGINDQKWDSQIHGKGGLISALNSRLFVIKRMKNYLNKNAQLKLVDGLFTAAQHFKIKRRKNYIYIFFLM